MDPTLVKDVLMSSQLYFDALETQDDNDIEIASSASEQSLEPFATGDDETNEAHDDEIVQDLSGEIDEDVDMDGTSEDGVEKNNGLKGDGRDGELRLEGRVLKPRNYQLEMLEESLRRNIIVAMDTGSGKTQIAVLRIAAELERTSPDKLIWFMAPTVELCRQQSRVLEEQLPPVQVKFLSSADNVDRWTTQELWNAVLHNVRVVISTYQILLDALTHAFVSMDSIALLVFDEAHNCVKSNPGSLIMRDFYMPKLLKAHKVPHILGLSASPIMNSNVMSLEKIEATFNAVCCTPNKYRAELLQQVKLPEASHVLFMPRPETEYFKCATATLASLHKVYEGLDIHEDPYVRKLKLQNTERSARKLEKAFKSRGTYCQDQFKSLCLTSTVIFRELGGWAADFYVGNAITRFTSIAEYLEGFDIEEKKYLAETLKKVDISLEFMKETSALDVSDKVSQFIKTLLEAYHPGFLGIVFVEQRATVAVLAHLLSLHPDTKNLFDVGTFVGTSQDLRRITNIGDVLHIINQGKALEDFKNGTINLMVATSALEEGIDVPACNTVICFNEPDNLKVLVQRRGRARSHKSKLILMFDGQNDKVDKWLEFEKQMKLVYADDMRKLKGIEALENIHEPGHREFRVEKTGALLNLENAIQHLYHFCATLPASEYVDLRPDFICDKVNETYIRAKVILPTSVHERSRYAEGQQAWPSERDAIRDAAFEACVLLYQAGLINDHLLPLTRDEPPGLKKTIENRSPQVNVSPQFDPWMPIAKLLSKQTEVIFHRFVLRVITESGTVVSEMKMILPHNLTGIAPISIYWDAITTLKVTIQPMSPCCAPIQAKDVTRCHVETAAIIQAAYGHRFSCDRLDFLALFMPNSSATSNLLRFPEQKLASSISFPDSWEGDPLIIRDTLNKNRPCLYYKWLPNKPAETSIRNLVKNYDTFDEDIPYLALKPLPKRADFLHFVPLQNELPSSNKPFHYVLPASLCMVDKLPFSLVQFALLLPSILHRIQVHMVASTLASSILRDVAFTSLQPVITAISAPVAREQENYQRQEFLGDSVLKLCTTVQLFVDHPAWHEGYLSEQKDHYVSNARLSRAASESGLHKFILTKPFTGNKWRPMYVSDLLEKSEGKTRLMSTKMLADVVEALLGAAMVDGGFSKAVACLRVFMPELDWMSLNTNQHKLFALSPSDMILPTTLQPLEDLIRYNFQKKALLIESMTHASYTSATASLERLEFLGDSILDTIIVDQVFNHNKQLPVPKMHLLRTALVNADFLAFMCMEFALEQEKVELMEIRGTKRFEEVKSQFSLPLWKFMRHASPPIAIAQQNTIKRYHLLRSEIKEAITHSDHYPWIPLARLQAPKFFSDIVESILGAVWIDSGSLDVCEGILERMGVMPYLRRIVEDEVHLWHPKEELGQLANTEKVRYVVRKRERDEDGVKDMKEMVCEVFVGERLVGKGEGECGKELLMGIAAQEGVRLMKGERGS